MTDAAFLDWIRRQPSCITGRFAEYLESGLRCNHAAHVRRAGAAGTGYKPEFSAVPLTFLEHDVQTRHGELACLKEFLPRAHAAEMFDGISHDGAVLKAKHWFDGQVALHLQRWLTMTEEGRRWAKRKNEVTV